MEELRKLNSGASHTARHRKRKLGKDSRNADREANSKKAKGFFSKLETFKVTIDLDAQEADTLSESSDVEEAPKSGVCYQKSDLDSSTDETKEADGIKEDQLPFSNDTSKESAMANSDEDLSIGSVEQVSKVPPLDFKEVELVYQKYVAYTRQRLSEGNKASCDLIKSKITDLSLCEFISARKTYCSYHHSNSLC